MRQRTSIIVDSTLRLAAQRYARRRGMTYSDVIDAALRDYLAEHETYHALSFMGLGQSKDVVDLSDGKDEEALRIQCALSYLARPFVAK